MFRIGTIEIHLVHAGLVWADSGGAWGLVPRVLWMRYLQPDAHQRVPMVLTSLLVRAGGKTILVDTGLGDKLDAKARRIWGVEYPHGTLLDGLARLGVTPADVDIVINTHLHADHCGGNTRRDANGQAVAVFTNAEYIVQRVEYEDASHPNERTRATYHADNFQPLRASGQLTLLEGDAEIVPGVHCMVTPGHTDAHQSVLFQDGGQSAFFVGDMASYAVHFEKLAWTTAYDIKPLVTLETKRRWQRWALENDALLLFQHDPQILAGRLVEDERGKRRVEKVGAAFD